MVFARSVAALTLAALLATPTIAGAGPSRASHRQAARAASKSASADAAAWTTINGTQYPTDLSADAPAPVIQDNWWLDKVAKNDTSIHTFKYSSKPKTSEEGQMGTNACEKGKTSGQDSMCQTVMLNSADDFCLWGPPKPNTNISVSESYEVAWCTKDHGTRMIPEGTLTGVHFVKTSAYVQVTGTGDFTKINIAPGDLGGELDPHGATGNGNPIGGLVYTTAYSGKHEQIHEWMSEISATSFCFRGCLGTNATSQMLCSHVYDEMGCDFIMPANYSAGTFEGCEGDVAMAPGIISTWTFTQGDPVTPSARSAPASSNCQTISSPVGLSASTGAAAAAAAATGTSGALAVGNKAAAAVAGGSASAAAPTYSGSAGMASSESGSTSGAAAQHGGAATTALAVVVAGFVAAVALIA